MNVWLIDGYGYTRTQLTDDLHETFGFRTDIEIIKKAKMRNIISKSKILLYFKTNQENLKYSITNVIFKGFIF